MSEDTASNQQAIVDWLNRPETHNGAPVEHIETHISHVFLAGDRVFKLKKAVDPGFLDYSTPAKRKAAAEEELRVNRRTAPAMYLSVQPILRRSGGFAMGEAGEATEDAADWLVVMRRFGQTALFDRMAETGQLEEWHVAGLADALAALHDGAEIRTDHGGAAGMRAHARFPLDALAKADEADLPFEKAAASELGEQLEAEWRRLSPRLEARRRHGRVRHGHGDLHLGNACLFEGRATPFDAIEFSEEIACVDILYDAAFTVMDLLAHDRRSLASLFLSRYLEATRDTSGLACLGYFVSIRALVRAMASAFGGKADWARRYFALARASLEDPPRPQLVAVGGLSGTGKSTLARRLALDIAPGVGAVHLRSDALRKRLFGAAPEDRLPDTAYSGAASRTVYTRLDRAVRRALIAGYPAIADATFTDGYTRAAMARAATAPGARFDGLWLEAAPATLRARVAGRPADASDADLAVLERQLSDSPGRIDWHRISAEGSQAETLDRARAALGLASGNP